MANLNVLVIFDGNFHKFIVYKQLSLWLRTTSSGFVFFWE